MSDKRWSTTESFIATCKAFTEIDDFHRETGHPERCLSPTIEDVNYLQDLLIEQGYAIQKIKE